jgi:hypothetical protein
VDIETVHRGSSRSRFERALAILAGLTAVLAALLATLQVDASRWEEQARVNATRLAVQVFEGSAATGILSTYQFQTAQEATLLSIDASARDLQAAQAPAVAASQQAMATAETRTAERLTIAGEAMSRAPDDASPVDAHTRAVLALTVDDMAGSVEELNDQLALADQYGTRGTRAVFALSLLAIGAVLLGLAGVMGATRTGRISFGASAVALLLSVIWAGMALAV